MKFKIGLITLLLFAALMPAVLWVRSHLPRSWTESNIDTQMVFQCTADTAIQYKGHIAEITGALVEVKMNQRGSFLNFEEPYPKQALYAHLSPSNRNAELRQKVLEMAAQVDDLGFIQVKVSGPVKGAKKPYIELVEPWQIERIPADSAPSQDDEARSGIAGR